jgi:hypothetical protein
MSWDGGAGLINTLSKPLAAGCGWIPATLCNNHTSDEPNMGWLCENVSEEKNHASHIVVALSTELCIIHLYLQCCDDTKSGKQMREKAMPGRHAIESDAVEKKRH